MTRVSRESVDTKARRAGKGSVGCELTVSCASEPLAQALARAVTPLSLILLQPRKSFCTGGTSNDASESGECTYQDSLGWEGVSRA